LYASLCAFLSPVICGCLDICIIKLPLSFGYRILELLSVRPIYTSEFLGTVVAELFADQILFLYSSQRPQRTKAWLLLACLMLISLGCGFLSLGSF